MNGAPIFSIRARVIAGAGNATVFSADFRTLKFHSAFRDFNTVTTHATAGRADWNPVIINGEVIFINRWSSTFAIKVDERCYIFTFAVLIVRHGIMCRIQKKLRYFVIRKKSFHPKKGMQKAMGIMFRGTRKMRKHGQVAFRVHEHV